MNPPTAELRNIQTSSGTAIGAAYAWDGGQYCAIHTGRGMIGCGIFDIESADEFSMAVAIAKGTPEHPLCEPEDLFQARIVASSKAATKLGITAGMTGLEALEKMLSAG